MAGKGQDCIISGNQCYIDAAMRIAEITVTMEAEAYQYVKNGGMISLLLNNGPKAMDILIT